MKRKAIDYQYQIYMAKKQALNAAVDRSATDDPGNQKKHPGINHSPAHASADPEHG